MYIKNSFLFLIFLSQWHRLYTSHSCNTQSVIKMNHSNTNHMLYKKYTCMFKWITIFFFRRNHQNSVKHARKKPTKLEVSWEFFEFTHWCWDLYVYLCICTWCLPLQFAIRRQDVLTGSVTWPYGGQRPWYRPTML